MHRKDIRPCSLSLQAEPLHRTREVKVFPTTLVSADHIFNNDHGKLIHDRSMEKLLPVFPPSEHTSIL